MKITVINGTQKQGVTWKLKEIFLDELREEAEITEFYLPKDCPDFCVGCTTCFRGNEHKCKDAEYVQKIEKALLWCATRQVDNRKTKKFFLPGIAAGQFYAASFNLIS